MAHPASKSSVLGPNLYSASGMNNWLNALDRGAPIHQMGARSHLRTCLYHRHRKPRVLRGKCSIIGDMSPRVSVLMLTYNRPQFIGKAIQSILAQQFQEWELLVVHDGPNEEIPVVMEEWQKRDSRIHYFRRIIPGNIAEASNFGLAHARGEYIAILYDDDYWA